MGPSSTCVAPIARVGALASVARVARHAPEGHLPPPALLVPSGGEPGRQQQPPTVPPSSASPSRISFSCWINSSPITANWDLYELRYIWRIFFVNIADFTVTEKLEDNVNRF